MTCVGMSSTAVADVLIAVAMCWCLYHKRTGFSRRVVVSSPLWNKFDIHVQNRLDDYDADVVQCQLWPVDEVRLYSAYSGHIDERTNVASLPSACSSA